MQKILVTILCLQNIIGEELVNDLSRCNHEKKSCHPFSEIDSSENIGHFIIYFSIMKHWFYLVKIPINQTNPILFEVIRKINEEKKTESKVCDHVHGCNAVHCFKVNTRLFFVYTNLTLFYQDHNRN